MTRYAAFPRGITPPNPNAVLTVIDNESARTTEYPGWAERVYGASITTRTRLIVKVPAEL